MKKLNVFVSMVLILGMLFTGCGQSKEEETGELEKNTSGNATYKEKIFTTDVVHNIEIQISDEDWTDLKENPTEKTKYKATVTIDGETINEVSFATKGNTSLTSVAQDKDSDRYSFKINFGKYVDGQTYYGLNKLNLNNLYADATYMKDYFSYRIFEEAGFDSSLTSYVWLTVNGEEAGLYLAIEEVDSSYLERTADGEGELYKPETEQLANMAGKNNQLPDNMELPDDMEFPENIELPDDMEFPENMEKPDNMELPENTEKSEKMEKQGNTETSEKKEFTNDMQPPAGEDMENMPNPNDGTNEENPFNGEVKPEKPEGDGTFNPDDLPDNFGGNPWNGANGNGMPNGGFMGSDNGASLKYTDDNIDSYSDIFDNAETNVEEEDKERVIRAIKKLSEGNIEDSLDTDSVITYFAAHNFVMNYDSYTGTMLHNYYLYEKDGKLSLIPWDYNLAFGAFINQGNFTKDSQDATDIINYGIDSPLSGTEDEDRPMWSWITANEEYLEKYHEVMEALISNYFESGEFEEEINRVYEMLLPYVQKETTGFYNADEFSKAVETLESFCTKRAESIRLQLDGTLSTITSEQEEDKKVDASEITITDMGSQGGEKDKFHGAMGPTSAE